MAEFPSLPIWTDAYLADTAHLTNEEHGVYLRLLMYAWRSPNCMLPDDDRRLAIMVGVTLKKWAAIKPAVMAFWQKSDDMWVQKRLTQERNKVISIRDQRSLAGTKSGQVRARRSQTSTNDSVPGGNDSVQRQSKPTDTKKTDNKTPNILENNNTDATSVATNEPTGTQTADEESISISNKEKTGTKKGTRLSPDWTLPGEWESWARSSYPSVDNGKLKTEADKFRDYWHSKPGQGGVKLDWFATWRNWCRTAFGTAVQSSGDQQREAMVQLDRDRDSAVWSECERIRGKPFPTTNWTWHAPVSLVEQAKRNLKKS